ncbi:SYF2 [Sanghuangporus weigelae]
MPPRKRQTRLSKKAQAAAAAAAAAEATITAAVEEKVAEAVEQVKETAQNVAEGAKEFVEQMTGTMDVDSVGRSAEQRGDGEEAVVEERREERVDEQDENGATDSEPLNDAPIANGNDGENGNGNEKTLTMEERKKKLDELRKRMREATRENRTALLTESTKSKATIREAARREKQLRLAENLRLKTEAEERGEDGERSKNWEWTIEENEEWERRKRRKERNADFEFHDEEQQARKRYKKDLAFLKPDLETYNRQKQLALGATPGAASSSSSNALTTFDPSGGAITSYEQQRAAESLYRDANTLLYADNKPSEDAIDRVVEKLNLEQDKRNKFSRKRLNEDEGDITYINERNRVFNKKIARYYDKYTAEIRASFERGTAL